MKLNSHVIFLIAIVGIIAGATMLNNGAMKQTDFDGIKVSVPADSNFVKTADGYADSKYGITIHTFKNNDSMVNYLKGKSGVSVISLKNQPPQSVAFVQGDDTNVLVTNGGEAIAIGAKDQGLVSDMANTVVFSNHQKSAKPNPVIPVISPPPHLEFHRDFYLIVPILAKINTKEFNTAIFETNINNTINDYNIAAVILLVETLVVEILQLHLLLLMQMLTPILLVQFLLHQETALPLEAVLPPEAIMDMRIITKNKK